MNQGEFEDKAFNEVLTECLHMMHKLKKDVDVFVSTHYSIPFILNWICQQMPVTLKDGRRLWINRFSPDHQVVALFSDNPLATNRRAIIIHGAPISDIAKLGHEIDEPAAKINESARRPDQ